MKLRTFRLVIEHGRRSIVNEDGVSVAWERLYSTDAQLHLFGNIVQSFTLLSEDDANAVMHSALMQYMFVQTKYGLCIRKEVKQWRTMGVRWWEDADNIATFRSVLAIDANDELPVRASHGHHWCMTMPRWAVLSDYEWNYAMPKHYGKTTIQNGVGSLFDMYMLEHHYKYYITKTRIMRIAKTFFYSGLMKIEWDDCNYSVEPAVFITEPRLYDRTDALDHLYAMAHQEPELCKQLLKSEAWKI